MIVTTRLKIWTLISHACIVIGFGHGIVTLGIVQFFWLSTIFRDVTSTGSESDVSVLTLQLVACMCLAGQIGIISSVYLKQQGVSRWIHIGGLCLLWASVITFAYGIRNDNYAHLAVLSCLPFTYCSIRTLLGRHIQLLWQKIDARI